MPPKPDDPQPPQEQEPGWSNVEPGSPAAPHDSPEMQRESTLKKPDSTPPADPPEPGWSNAPPAPGAQQTGTQPPAPQPHVPPGQPQPQPEPVPPPPKW